MSLLSQVCKLPFSTENEDSPLPILQEEQKVQEKETIQLSILYEFLYIYKIIVIWSDFKFFASLFFIFKYTYKQNYEIHTHRHTLYLMFLVSKSTCICTKSSANTRVWCSFSRVNLHFVFSAHLHFSSLGKNILLQSNLVHLLAKYHSSSVKKGNLII